MNHGPSRRGGALAQTANIWTNEQPHNNRAESKTAPFRKELRRL